MKYTKKNVSAVSPRIDWKTINWKKVSEYVKKLRLENFSGKTVIAVKQEFYAAVYLANLCAAVTKVADAQIKADDLKKLSNIPVKPTELVSLTDFLSSSSPLSASLTTENAKKS